METTSLLKSPSKAGSRAQMHLSNHSISWEKTISCLELILAGLPSDSRQSYCGRRGGYVFLLHHPLFTHVYAQTELNCCSACLFEWVKQLLYLC